MMNRHLLFCFGLLFFVSSVSMAQSPSRVWEGNWNNKKYGTSGPLKCVAQEVKPGQWKATFTGLFQGDPFEYKAEFESKPAKANSKTLSGKSTIRGHRYQWKGSMRGPTLIGDYTSSVGYHGRFQLKEASKR